MPRERSTRIRATFLTLIAHSAFACCASAALPRVPEGFKIRLVAAVPAVQYPCQVATAPDGSLFVGEDPMDQVGPANQPIDRILVFREGRDPLVFADRLNAVFGMAWHDGALYVMNMPNLTVLRDTDGDGIADERKELFTDLGVPAGQPNLFNDHIVSGIQIGIDGFLYISVGDKGVPKATGPDGRSAQVFGGGVLRCRLDGTGLEVYSTGTRNHLEPNLDAADNLFTYDNTDDGLGWWTRVTHHIDGGYYGYPWDYHDRTERMLGRMNEYGGGSPCGGLVYKEDAWPETYRGRAFWAEWGKRSVRAFRFRPKGASFEVEDLIEFVQPGEVSDFRPLDLTLSYDGKTLFVADWGYGGWQNKTEKFGRVYAVEYEGETTPRRPRGHDSDTIDAQIRQLDHASFNERFRARSALVKKGREALGAVTAALEGPTTDALARRHLVWTLDALAGGTPEASFPLIDALQSPVADVRAQAARALGARAVPLAVKGLTGLLADPAPSVRLEAVIALGRIGDPSAIPAIVPLFGDSDTYLAFSARTALRRIGVWKPVAAILQDSADPKVRAGLLLAMEMVYDLEAAETLGSFAADPARDPSERARAVFLLAQGHRRRIPWDGKWWGTQPAKRNPPPKSIDWDGTPLVLRVVRERLSDSAAAVRKAAVRAVRDTADPLALEPLRARFDTESDVDVRVEIAWVLGALGDKPALPLLIAALRDTRTSEPVRDAALESVTSIGSDVALSALLELIDTNDLTSDRRARIASALGAFSAGSAVDALVRSLEDPAPAVRGAAAIALGKVRRSEKEIAKPLRARLDDPALEVRKQAISALGSIHDREAIPALIAAANSLDTRFEASLALASVPDVQALPIYLRGLTDKSIELRTASSTAIAAIRDAAEPVLEQLSARKELPTTALPELRKIYTAMRPVRTWKLLGPIPIDAKAPFSLEGAIDLRAKYSGFQDEPLEWKNARGVGPKGEVELGSVYQEGEDVAAYGFTEVVSPTDHQATLSVASDDTLTVWVNGEKSYDFQDRRGFDDLLDQFDAPLKKGKNRIVVKCGNWGGAWKFSLAVSVSVKHGFLEGPSPGTFDPEAYRKFAMAIKGDPERGKALFADLKGLACVKCHAVGGKGGVVGPELSSAGAKYPKDELITAVLYPSAKISSGYEPVVIQTVDGRILTGIIKGENPDSLEIEDVDANRIRLSKADIEDRKRSDVSLMPNGLAEGLSQRDFADLISFLETLKDAKTAGER